MAVGSFIVRFEHNVKNFDFTLVCRQLDHRTSSLEIDGLRRTVRHVKTTFPDESDIIVLAGISGVWDSLEIDELLSPVTTDGYIRLFYDAPPAAAASDRCPDTHFLIASHSDALFWEEPKWVAAASASIERLTPGQPVFEQPAGFSAFVIVNDEQTEEDSERKAGCFFVSSSS